MEHHELQRPPGMVNISHVVHRPDYRHAVGGGSVSAKQIIDGINHAVTSAQRCQAVHTAMRAFNHKNEQMHNYEFDMGATNALCLKLGYVLLQNARSHPCDFYREISMICAALRMVYGCSVDRREHSFQEIGQSELVPFLVQIIGSGAITSSEMQIRCAKNDAIYRTIQLLRVFCKLDGAKHFLTNVNEKSLLVSLAQLCGISAAQDIAIETRLEATALIKDLAFRSSDDVKEQIFSVDGLVPMLISQCVTSQAGTEESKQGEYVSAILWNLALSKELSIKMTASSSVLRLLIALTGDDNRKTRRNATSAIGNLATVTGNVEGLLAHDKGLLISALIETTEKDDDTDCRRRAMRTIRCLSAEKSSTIVERVPSFGEYLVRRVDTDSDTATRVQACETIGHFARDVGVSITMASSLICIITSETDCKFTGAACRALVRCIQKAPADIAALQFPASFFRGLEAVAKFSKEPEDHASAAQLLLLLERDEEMKKLIMTEFTLNALTVLLSMVGSDFEQSRIDAMHVVTNLVAGETNIRRMAEHEDLLTALVNFALATPEGDKKDEAKAVILKLVPEL